MAWSWPSQERQQRRQLHKKLYGTNVVSISVPAQRRRRRRRRRRRPAPALPPNPMVWALFSIISTSTDDSWTFAKLANEF